MMIPDEARNIAERVMAEKGVSFLGQYGKDARVLAEIVLKMIDAQPQAPQPDWSQAPFWATWWCALPWGNVIWADREMTDAEIFMAFGGDPVLMLANGLHFEFGTEIEIPPFVDWRTLREHKKE